MKNALDFQRYVRRLQRDPHQALAVAGLVLLASIWLIPIAWIVISSFKPEVEIQTLGFRIFPVNWTFQNYYNVLIRDTAAVPVVRWFWNSVFIASSTTALTLFVGSLAAYAYSRMQWRGRNVIFWFLIATMMFPPVINMIPLYKIVDELNWIDTAWAMVVPASAGVFNLFLIRQFMIGIPRDYDESAKMDGASDWKIFANIIVPLSKPVLTLVGLFAFTGSWNDFLWPTIVFNRRQNLPLTAGLQLLQGIYDIRIAHIMASTVVAIIPTLLLFLMAQKYFLSGISISSGVKG